MNSITHLYASLSNELPARQVAEYVQFAQSESFFHLAVAKDVRSAVLKAHFSKAGLRKVYLSARLSSFECEIDGVEVVTLEKDFFQEQDPVRYKAKKSLVEDCIVIVSNNDIYTAEEAYAVFFAECTKTCFIAWDWDNHHWLSLSTFLAAHSDIYAPAHHENLYLLSRYNWLTVGPVYSSSEQWPRKFLTEHLSDMLEAERSDAPLGMHTLYGSFSFRNQVVSTLSQHYPSIGFTSSGYHLRTLEDRLKEWCSHKTHWIMPVLNDVPVRIFDALVTGGVLIVPSSLRFLPPVNAIPREYIVFYSPADIVNPQPLVEHANELFDAGARDGIVARHRFALQHHHGNTSVRQMLSFAAEMLGIKVVW